MSRILKVFSGVVVALLFARPALADPCASTDPAGDVCYDLAVPTPTSGYYEEVAIKQLVSSTSNPSTDEVQVTVTLGSDATKFVTTGSGQHPTFGFNLNVSSPTITVVSNPSDWSVETGPISTSGGINNSVPGHFGSFGYAIVDKLGNGSSHGITSPLVFDITATGISAASFVGSSGGQNYLFVSDILSTSGATGLVGRVPEAPTPFFFGAGLLGLLMFSRRKSLKPIFSR